MGASECGRKEEILPPPWILEEKNQNKRKLSKICSSLPCTVKASVKIFLNVLSV
jgi:hypothetical protein